MKRMVSEFAVAVVATVLVAGGVALASPSNVPDAGTVQTDGQVSAIVVSGNKIYLGGYFTHVDGVQRNRLAALDATTGQLTSWNPNANDNVRSLAVSADGSRIYAGGAFSSVGGVNRTRLAAIDAATGAVDPLWRPQANSTVSALAVSSKGIYLGGSFTSINGQSRSRLALVDATTGALEADWVPSANDKVRTLAVASDGSRIYAGGNFGVVNGKSRPYLTALEPSTGALDSAWVTPTKPNGKVYDLEESGGRLYTAEGGLGGAVSAYSTTTGISSWRTKVDGDVQTLAVMGSEVYLGGHFEAFSGQNRHFFAAVDASTGTLDPAWAPTATGGCGAWVPSTCNGFVWALTADPSAGRLYAGGDFRKVSGVAHAGFARFS
jgi:trimeric autotransporter adhesin